MARNYPGVDTDALTQSEFDDLLSLIPTMLKWENGQGQEAMSDLGRRRMDWDVRLRETFGDGVADQGDEDELGGG